VRHRRHPALDGIPPRDEATVGRTRDPGSHPLVDRPRLIL
jgi:hypothetical protein